MIRIYENADALARGAATAIAEAASEAIAARGHFRLGLSGGSTPRVLFEVLSGEAFRGRIDWAHCIVGFTDERAVPCDHADSNARLARDALIVPASIPEANVHRMEGESADLEGAAERYARFLADPFDLLLLGIGEDGHTASLFPGSTLVGESDRRVAVVTDSPKPPPRRITVTPRVIGEARCVMVLASGASKAWAVKRALDGDTPAIEVPARLARDRDWYLDRDAAAHLSL